LLREHGATLAANSFHTQELTGSGRHFSRQEVCGNFVCPDGRSRWLRRTHPLSAPRFTMWQFRRKSRTNFPRFSMELVEMVTSLRPDDKVVRQIKGGPRMRSVRNALRCLVAAECRCSHSLGAIHKRTRVG
jgi:hypothetical protein